MDNEYILRRAKPSLVTGTTVTMKRWVEDQAAIRKLSQADIVNEALQQYKERVEAAQEREPVEMAS